MLVLCCLGPLFGGQHYGPLVVRPHGAGGHQQGYAESDGAADHDEEPLAFGGFPNPGRGVILSLNEDVHLLSHINGQLLSVKAV